MTKKRRREANKEAKAEAAEAAALVDDPGSEAKSFGPWLRRQREGRGIELRDIAQASKISLRYLDALETNHFEALPAEIFTKGFLRQYAAFVGLDAEEVVNYYLAARAAADEEKAEELPNELRLEEPSAPSPLPYVILALLVAALLVALIWWLTARGDSTTEEPGRANATQSSSGRSDREATERAEGEEPTAPDRAADRDAGPDAPPAGATSGEAADAPVTAPTDKPVPASSTESDAPIVLVLDFSADCWVEATIDDGRSRVAEMHVQGESLRLTADEQIELMVGNIQAVDMELNGRRWQPPGSGGPVRRLAIDLATARGERPADPPPTPPSAATTPQASPSIEATEGIP